MKTLFVDTNVLLYAFGGDSPHRESCRRLIRGVENRRLDLHCSAELIQEFLFHRLRKDSRAAALAQARTVARLCTVHPVDDDVVTGMLDLVETTLIGGRDAIHAATAIGAGFDQIVSFDPDLDVPGRLTPVRPAGVLPRGSL